MFELVTLEEIAKISLWSACIWLSYSLTSKKMAFTPKQSSRVLLCWKMWFGRCFSFFGLRRLIRVGNQDFGFVLFFFFFLFNTLSIKGKHVDIWISNYSESSGQSESIIKTHFKWLMETRKSSCIQDSVCVVIQTVAWLGNFVCWFLMDLAHEK